MLYFLDVISPCHVSLVNDVMYEAEGGGTCIKAYFDSSSHHDIQQTKELQPTWGAVI